MKSIGILIIFIFVTMIKTDLPSHCLSVSIEGKWNLNLGSEVSFQEMSCGHSFPDTNLDHINTNYRNFHINQVISVHLERPNIVYDENKTNQIGTWTMIYDEGFEIFINGISLFAFSKYKKLTGTPTNKDNSDTPGYISYCGETFLGWFSNSNNNTVGCVYGLKSDLSGTLTKMTSDASNSLHNVVQTNNNSNNISSTQYVPQSPLQTESKSQLSNSIINNDDLKSSIRDITNSDDFSNILDGPIPFNHQNTIPHYDIYFGTFMEMDLEMNMKTFEPDHSFINKINKDKTSLWRAKEHDEFNGKTYSFMRKILGMGNQKNIDISKFNSFMELTSTVSSNLSNKFKIKSKNQSKSNSNSNSNSLHFMKTKSKFKFKNASNTLNKHKEMIKNSEKKLNNNYDLNLDRLDEQFNMMNNSENFSTKKEKITNNGIPSSFDWRNVNNVNFDSPVRRQGECGSCYAIAAISTLESRIRIKTNNKLQPNLSVSSAISCSRFNQGCEGGYPYLIGKYGKEFGFIDESCQPYTEQDNYCNKTCNNKYKVLNYGFIGGYYGGCDEEKMMKEIYNNGPIVVAINASPELYYYSNGIFTSNVKRTEGEFAKGVKAWEYTNHAVVCVGWGEEVLNGKLEKYWILKNSWGDNWGDNGYFKLKKGMASVEAQGEFLIPSL